MAENMKGIMWMIRKKAKVYFIGQMEESTREAGKTESSMEAATILLLVAN